MIHDLRPLTQEQRQDAHRNAREAVLRAIGPRPTREHFTYSTISKYPPAVTRLILLLCRVLLAAFTRSAIRLRYAPPGYAGDDEPGRVVSGRAPGNES